MAPSVELLPGNLDWDTAANNRRARFHKLTPLGRRPFAQEQSSWQRLVDAIAQSRTATPQEI
jgi:hypothetical protein